MFAQAARGNLQGLGPGAILGIPWESGVSVDSLVPRRHLSRIGQRSLVNSPFISGANLLLGCIMGYTQGFVWSQSQT